MDKNERYRFEGDGVKPRVLHKIQLPGYVETLEEVDEGVKKMRFSEALVKAEHLADYREKTKRSLQMRLWEEAMRHIEELAKNEPRENLLVGAVRFEEEPGSIPGEVIYTGKIMIYRKVRGSEVLVEQND